ncbi:hypothetical protein ACET3X_003586 [Alternaria dauci]|uniref:RRM domain-containing protein n=1 Tax=Alternaria dauci TaxID=48095 RepID=A0ABR3UV43_9PLEO
MTPPTTRVVRLANVHFDATEEDIRQFFQGYTVIDQVRAFDPWAVGTLSNVYVLFSTTGDMDAVVATHQNCQIRGRHINIIPAPIGNYDLDASRESFVRLGDNDTLSAAARKLATYLVRMASDDPAFEITREEEAGLRQELHQSTQEEHDRAGSNKKNVLARVLHAYSKNLQRRSRDENRSKKPLYRAPYPVPVPFKHRVPSPDLQNREDPRSRVLLITGIPIEADNDAVMTFLRSYRPESIDRAQIGGNWMVSALVLMQTSEGRDRAVEEMSGQMIQGQRVVVHTFSNLTQGNSRHPCAA